MKMEKPMTNQEGTIFGFSVEGLLNWTNVLYLVSVAAALFFSVALWRLSAISSENKDRQLERYKMDAHERVSQAEAVARQAQEASSLANERAKALELETEKAKLETERLKAKLAWRILTQPQHQMLLASLSQHTGAATIAHVANDPESLYLAIQIANIFSEANWTIGFQSLTLSGAISFGISVPNSKSEDALLIESALQSASIPFGKNIIPPTVMMTGSGGISEDSAVLFVGTKPQ
jgi:hypothetical protein